MGRRRLYNTEEERRAAARERSKRYYSRKKDDICEAKRERYSAKRASKLVPTRIPPVPLTEEEQRLKNRLKSQRYYERKKSVIKMRRKNNRHSSNAETSSSSGASLKRRVERDMWEQHISFFWGEIPKVQRHQDVRSFVEGVTTAYLREGLRSVIEDALKPLKELRWKIDFFHHNLVNNLGAGARLTETLIIIEQVDHVRELLEDLEAVVIEEGRASMMGKYVKRELLYQRRYPLRS